MIKIFGKDSAIVTRGINDVVVIDKGDTREQWCQTLCVTENGTIYVNKEFWFTYITDDRDAEVVLLHELLHIVFGDTDKKINHTEKDLSNFSQDARINAAVSHILTNKLYNYCTNLTLLDNLYKHRDQKLLATRKVARSNKYFKLHSVLYPQQYRIYQNDIVDISDESLRNTIKLMVPLKVMQETLYLGSHNNSDDDDKSDSIPKPSDSYKDIVSQSLKDIVESITQSGYGIDINSYILKLIQSNQRLQLRVLKRFTISKKLNVLKGFFEEEEPVADVVPINPSKGDLAQVACGYLPVFWHNTDRFMKESESGCAVYLDVSGSVIEYLPKILALLRNIKRNINTIFCFSNKVVEKSIAALSRGEIDSTGGTDFDCVIKHTIENNYKKIIIFTDGYADLKEANKRECESKINDVAVILFGNSTNKKNYLSEKYTSYMLDDIVK